MTIGFRILMRMFGCPGGQALLALTPCAGQSNAAVDAAIAAAGFPPPRSVDREGLHCVIAAA